MAFTQATDRIDAVRRAGDILGQLRTIRLAARDLIAYRNLYVAATDPSFNAAFNAIFSSAPDRAKISAMITQLETLIADWELNQTDVLGL